MQAPNDDRGPIGFSFSGVAAGIKARKRDLGLIFSEERCASVGLFTQSALRSASVGWCQRILPAAHVRALVVSSGNANTLTGSRGELAASRMAGAVASRLDITKESALVATTGVIGTPFPIDRVERGAERLVAELGPSITPLAESMLTTDTRTKIVSREIFIGGTKVRVTGIAKGSGMVHPNLATILGFVLTDAQIALPAMSEMFRRSAEDTWNALSVDQSTSPNDAAIFLANGMAENAPIVDANSEGAHLFEETLRGVMDGLARDIADDGEGARHFLEVTVRGATSVAACRDLARSVVGNSLVKAAIFGTDANVGRVLAAIGGRAGEMGIALDERALAVSIQGVVCFEHGEPCDIDRDALRAQLRQRNVVIDVCVGAADTRGSGYGCDLSYDYVRINADYAAVLADPDGPVRRDTRLDTKTPELKTEILVAALRYIERFANTRAVIRYGATTLSSSQRAVSFAEDVRLLSAAGLRPILVQEGSSELVVTALAQAGMRAVGLSGADGGLLAWPRTNGAVVVDPDVVETLLAKGYVPVIVPEFTEEASRIVGSEGSLDVDRVAAEVAVACGAKKLLFLGETTGLIREGVLLSELTAEDLSLRIDERRIDEALLPRCEAAREALARGVDSTHFLDERTAHVVVAELFTETGVGTMVR